jgi:hypothetical protein
MSLQSQFSKFEEKIRLTWNDSKLKEIREKDESIQEDIRSAFKEKGYSVEEFFQQGSYATQTCIEPSNEGGDYDIDVGVVINASNAPENPVEVKKTLKNVLVNRNLKNPKIKMPCVTAQYYKEGEKRFHLDYPIYKKNQNLLYLAIGKESSDENTRKWEQGDPKGLINWVNDKSKFSSEENYIQYKRLVRYLKRWRDYCITGTERKHIYSIALTVMTRELYQPSISYDGEYNDLESLRKTVSSILNYTYFKHVGFDSNNNPQYEIVVNLPVEPYGNIFNKHGRTLGTFLHNKFSSLKNNLDKVSRETDIKKQCEILANDVFGDDFPIPEDKNKSANQKFKEAGFIASPQGA